MYSVHYSITQYAWCNVLGLQDRASSCVSDYSEMLGFGDAWTAKLMLHNLI